MSASDLRRDPDSFACIRTASWIRFPGATSRNNQTGPDPLTRPDPDPTRSLCPVLCRRQQQQTLPTPVSQWDPILRSGRLRRSSSNRSQNRAQHRTAFCGSYTTRKSYCTAHHLTTNWPRGSFSHRLSMLNSVGPVFWSEKQRA